MRRLLIAVPLVFLALVSTAVAGGWATVGMSSTPDGVQPGKPWVVDMTVLQHGRTPLEGLSPSLTIVNGDARQTFHAKETKEPGVYRVARDVPDRGPVELPGRRRLHQRPAAHVQGDPDRRARLARRPPRTPRRPTTAGPSLIWLIGGLALLAAAAALLFVRRPRHHHPQAA